MRSPLTGGVCLLVAAACCGCFVFADDIPPEAATGARDVVEDQPAADGDLAADGADVAADGSAADGAADAPGDARDGGEDHGRADVFDVGDGGGLDPGDADAADAAEDRGAADLAGDTDLGPSPPAGFVALAAGAFVMGSFEEPGAGVDEASHPVELTRDLLVATREVTRVEWRVAFEGAGGEPWFHPGGDELPVERVSWYEALAYANARSELEGLPACYRLWGCEGTLGGGCPAGVESCPGYTCLGVTYSGPACAGYRLPSEAEWEYLARAGTDTAYASGPSIPGHLGCEGPRHLAAHANYCASSPIAVASLAPNAAGIYDAAGNVAEWVFDGYDADYGGLSAVVDPYGPLAAPARVVRGGAYDSDAAAVRSAARFLAPPSERSARRGFRVVRFDARGGPTAPPGFAYVPAGTFLMGSPPGEPQRGADELQHAVTITRPFYVDAVELDQQRWGLIDAPNPALFEGPEHPVERVTHYEAQVFANRLSIHEGLTPCYALTTCGLVGLGQGCGADVRACDGLACAAARRLDECDGYRLPSEAEWEYAARAGATGPFYVGGAGVPEACDGPLAEVAHACAPGTSTRSVAAAPPNALGIFDVHGNVAELVEDAYESGYYAESPDEDPILIAEDPIGFSTRGGSFEDEPATLRLANREWVTPKRRSASVGFRLVRSAF